ncbi:plexin-D1-like [Lingula anatina]|uniref:Plexin-D1-like n=1 Tax=Lingula anatina TaxID=7574 RepID=A0A1S3K1L5_LINAN|nr:plexin-D1-like [Lingula anatina]|eukprot:XP_013416161.1 plexin-D1-like [Lingula anatina]
MFSGCQSTIAISSMLVTLAVLLSHAVTVRSSTIVSSYPSGQTTVEFNNIAIDNATGTVFIGAVNALYRLDGDLQLLQNATTGPVTDSPYCSPPPLTSTCSQGTPTDNYNKILVVDQSRGRLISCGSVYQGTCESRPVTDISQVTAHRGIGLARSPLENYVAANSRNASTVAFVAPGPISQNSQDVLYVASTYTGQGESGRLRDLVAALLCDKSKDNNQQYRGGNKNNPSMSE